MPLREVHSAHYHHFKNDSVAKGVGFVALMPARALAHCDGLDGPVVKAAQRALEIRNSARGDNHQTERERRIGWG